MPLDTAIRGKYQEVIGLEVHVQLSTQTKAYSSEAYEYGGLPNTQVSAINLAHPGVLPRSNKKVVDFAIKLGLALGCKITEHQYYDRKNYFYPDSPKNYQLTQDATPICVGGFIPITLPDGTEKKIALNRIHMEEDAGKSIHLDGETDTLIDLNRAGVPLLEVVTEPDIRTAEEAYWVMYEMRRLVRYLEISDGNMEEGSLRCDANVSVMLHEAKEYGAKVEVKNMNSMSNVRRAVEHEIDRQIERVEAGVKVDSETRLFEATSGTTRSMRTKEMANDYRYFPEPDLQPLHVAQEWVDRVASEMPPLPRALKEKFMSDFGLPEYDAGVLVEEKEIALYFDELASMAPNRKAASNWMMGSVKGYLNELTLHIADFPIKPQKLAELIGLVEAGKVSNSAAKEKLFPELCRQPLSDPATLAGQLGIFQDSDSSSIQPIIDQVMAEFPDKVAQVKAGQQGVANMLIGQVMKRSKGKADPKVVRELMEAALR